jgi:hypothetical protein
MLNSSRHSVVGEYTPMIVELLTRTDLTEVEKSLIANLTNLAFIADLQREMWFAYGEKYKEIGLQAIVLDKFFYSDLVVVNVMFGDGTTKREFNVPATEMAISSSVVDLIHSKEWEMEGKMK